MCVYRHNKMIIIPMQKDILTTISYKDVWHGMPHRVMYVQ